MTIISAIDMEAQAKTSQSGCLACAGVTTCLGNLEALLARPLPLRPWNGLEVRVTLGDRAAQAANIQFVTDLEVR